MKTMIAKLVAGVKCMRMSIVRMCDDYEKALYELVKISAYPQMFETNEMM